MAFVLADRVRDTTTTTGTGTVTLSGTSPTGYQTFGAGIGNGNNTYYTINADSQWEVGIGTYTASGTTLSRNTVLASSNGGALVDFAIGIKDVYCDYPAEKAVTDVYGTALAATTAANIGGGAAGSIPYQTAANTTSLLAAGTGVLIGGTTPSYTASPSLTQVTVAGDPSTALQVATKQYVDGLVSSGITYHEPVKYEVPNTTGNLNATYNQPGGAGVGVGATLTNNGTLAAFAPDGPTASVSDRILVYNQTSAFQNGIYTVTTVGSGSVAWVLTRATDADTYGLKSPNSLGDGDSFFVTSGDTGAGETYVCNTTGTITFGTTAITFVQVSDATLYTAGNGLQLTSGTVFSLIAPVTTVNGGTGLTAFTSGGAVYATSASVLTTGTLPATAGGTGQSSYTTGDLLYASSSTALSALADIATGNALISGGVGTAPSYGKIGLTTHISGTLAVGNGGTGATSLTGYLVGNGTSAFTTTATIPTSDLSGTISLTTQVSGTLGAGNGGTGLSSYTVGDILYASGTTTLASLADVATGNALISGGVSNAPLWGKIGLTTHVSGTLPVANGGSGATTLTGYLKGNGTSAFTASATIPSGDITGAALTKADDTNVTLTLGGSPSTALLAATSITAGWTGQLAVSRGGTGNSTLASGYLLKGNGVSPTSASVIYDSGTSIGINTSSPSEEIEAFGVDASIIVHYSGQSRGGIAALSGARIALTTTTSGDDLVFGYAGSPITSAGFVPRMTIDNGTGSITAGVDFRAPIFYDSNDTTYYIDPASNTTSMRTNGAWITNPTSTWGGDVAAKLEYHNNRWYASVNTAFVVRSTTGSEVFWAYNTGVVEASNDFRAPIFYDSANTAYYLDPTGSTSLNTAGNLITSGNLTLNNGANRYVRIGSATNYSYDLQTTGDDFQIIEAGTTPRLTIKYPSGDVGIGTSSPTNKLSISATGLDITGGNAINGTNMQGIRLQNTLNDNSSLGLWFGTNNVHWAGISGQRTNFAGDWTTDLRFYTHEAALVDITYARERMRIDGAGNVGVGTASPAGRFHALGPAGADVLYRLEPAYTYASKLLISSVSSGDGGIRYGTSNDLNVLTYSTMTFNTGAISGSLGTERLTINISGNVTANVDIRAPIFYDSDNTAYYVDGAASSSLSSLLIGYNGSTLAYNDGATGKLYFGSLGGDASTNYHITTNMENVGGNYSKLDFKWYTGQRFYTHYAYGGVRFKEITTGNTLFSVGEGDLRVRAYDSFSAPIFYDSSDTSYYVDPASTSIMGGVFGRGQLRATGWYGSQSASGTGLGVEIGQSGSRGYVLTYNRDTAAYGPMSFEATDFTFTGISGGFIGVNTSVRAPIFYDSDNTAFYVNPTSNSHLSELRIGTSSGDINQTGVIKENGATYGLGLFTWGDTAPIRIGGGSVNFAKEAGGILTVNFSSGSKVEGNGDIYARRDSGTTGVYYFVDGGSKYLYWDGGQYLFGSAGVVTSTSFRSSSDTRAPIFYDSNDTSYYVDPASGTVLGGNVSVLGGRNIGIDTSGGSITIKGDSGGWGTGLYFIGSAGTNRGGFGALGGGDGLSYLWAGNAYNNAALYLYAANYAESPGSFRAPIFYDSNNTAYYFDGASTSNWNTSGQQGFHTFNNYGLGIVGTYSPTRYQLVWALGDAYKGNADGTSLTSAYGLWFSYPSAGGPAANLSTHGLMLIQNGAFQASLDPSMRAITDMRAPIFYDLNNTGYYVDPNSTSNLLGLTVANIINGFVTGCTFAEDSVNKDDIATRSDSGFYQSSSGTTAEGWPINDGNWQHMISCTHTNDGNYFAMQLGASFFSQGLFYRSVANSGTQAWSRVALYGNGYAAPLYANVYYDADNTTYYLDPSTTGTSLNVAGAIVAGGNVTAYSDIRIKANIETIPSALDKLDQIRGVTYTRTDLEDKEQRYAGVIAQEIEAVLPEAVRDLGDIKAVDYNATIALLIQAVKELTDKVKALEAKEQ